MCVVVEGDFNWHDSKYKMTVGALEYKEEGETDISTLTWIECNRKLMSK